MAIGILQEEKNILVEIKEDNGSVVIDRTYIMESSSGCRDSVIGLPLENFIIKNLYLPNVTKKELPEAIELQMEFNIPNYKTDYDTNYVIKPFKAGYILHIVAAKKDSYDKKVKAVIPALLGVYAFAAHMKLFSEDSNTLLLYIDKKHCSFLTLKGDDVVFMRNAPREQIQHISSMIRLSSQAVFSQVEREFIDINKIIVFSEDSKDKDLVSNALTDAREVDWIDISKYRSEKEEIGNLFLPVGLALFDKQNKIISGWSVSRKPPGLRQSLKRVLFLIVPILIIFLPLYNYAQYYSKTSKVKAIEERINKFSVKLGGVDELGDKIAREKKLYG